MSRASKSTPFRSTGVQRTVLILTSKDVRDALVNFYFNMVSKDPVMLHDMIEGGHKAMSALIPDIMNLTDTELADAYSQMKSISDTIIEQSPSIDAIVMKTDKGRVILLSDPAKV